MGVSLRRNVDSLKETLFVNDKFIEVQSLRGEGVAIVLEAYDGDDALLFP